MARRRQPNGRKRRTREHVIADLSVNYLERAVLECGFVLEVKAHDYGFDATLVTFNARGEVENGLCEIQLKATDHLKLSADGGYVLQRVSGRDLKLWLFEVFPVFLVVYDAAGDRAFWLDLQEYARNPGIDADHLRTVTLRIPVRNVLNADAVRGWRETKNRIAPGMKGGRKAT